MNNATKIEILKGINNLTDLIDKLYLNNELKYYEYYDLRKQTDKIYSDLLKN